MKDKFEPVVIEDTVTTFFDDTPEAWMITDVAESCSPQMVLSREGALSLAGEILLRLGLPITKLINEVK